MHFVLWGILHAPGHYLHRQHICGGVIISPNFALTAYHCLFITRSEDGLKLDNPEPVDGLFIARAFYPRAHISGTIDRSKFLIVKIRSYDHDQQNLLSNTSTFRDTEAAMKNLAIKRPWTPEPIPYKILRIVAGAYSWNDKNVQVQKISERLTEGIGWYLIF